MKPSTPLPNQIEIKRELITRRRSDNEKASLDAFAPAYVTILATTLVRTLEASARPYVLQLREMSLKQDLQKLNYRN